MRNARYIKSTLIAGLPEEIYGYAREHAQFPDEPTSDQFFDEGQFEAYRELGYQLAKHALAGELGDACDQGNVSPRRFQLTIRPP